MRRPWVALSARLDIIACSTAAKKGATCSGGPLTMPVSQAVQPEIIRAEKVDLKMALSMFLTSCFPAGVIVASKHARVRAS